MNTYHRTHALLDIPWVYPWWLARTVGRVWCRVRGHRDRTRAHAPLHNTAAYCGRCRVLMFVITGKSSATTSRTWPTRRTGWQTNNPPQVIK